MTVLLNTSDNIQPGDIVFVPESMSAQRLLRAFQRQRTHLAVVLDEYGGVAGITTLEDAIEELVGEIFSEHDKPPEEMFVREAGGGVRMQGAMTVRDANRELGLEQVKFGPSDWS